MRSGRPLDCGLRIEDCGLIGPDDTGSHRELADVAHRVFRAVHEAADNGRGELAPADAAKVAEGRDIDGAKLRDGCVDASGQRSQNRGDVRGGKLLPFRLDRGELFGRQRLPASIGEEAIDDAGDVPHMKGGGGDPRRSGVPLRLRQRTDDLADTLANLKKDVRDGLKDGRDAVDGTALPPFGVGHAWTEFSARVGVHDALARKRRLEPFVTALARLDQLAIGRHQCLMVLRVGRLERRQPGV